MSRRDSRRSGGDRVGSHADEGRAGIDGVGRCALAGAAARAGPGGWRLRNWSLRSKLVVVLLIPTLTALALLGMRLTSEAGAAQRLGELSARVDTESSLAQLVHGLQRERDLTVRYVAGDRAGELDELQEQRGRVDEAIGEFDNAADAAEPELDTVAVDEFAEQRERLDVLTGLRYASEHSAYPPDAVLRSYSELISGLLVAREQAAATLREPELVRLQLAGSALAQAKNTMSVERALISESLSRGELSQEGRRAITGAQAERETALADFRTFATPEQQGMYDDTMTGDVVDMGNDITESVLARGEEGRSLDGVDAQQWDTAATYTIDLAYEVEDGLLTSMQERTQELAAQARTSALRDGAIVLGLLLLATLLTVFIARSLLRPLRVLRSSALDVAQHRLPAAVRGMRDDPWGQWSTDVTPVPVHSREELGQVARAFDAVHGEAVRLSVEQAALRTNVNAMFVNLSQSGRALAERQLSVLDRMEATEQDPETLAGLFELDHLAARLRRTGENLLVVTGNDYVRMLPGSVPATEVFGAALSEIDQYHRVELVTVPPVAVSGDTASDVVHVIAELLDNATGGPDPDVSVTLTSSVNHRGEWHVEITDDGVGLTDEAIGRANARLAEPPEIDAEATRRMGMYVVARLAARHGLRVWLQHAPTGGLIASILVPAMLITPLPEDAPDSAAVEPLRRPDLLKTDAQAESPESAGEDGRKPAPAGTPKRAPVMHESPVADDEPDHGYRVAHPLADEQPTDRFHAYQDVLSRWFRVSASNENPDENPDQGLDEGAVDHAQYLSAAHDRTQRPGEPADTGAEGLPDFGQGRHSGDLGPAAEAEAPTVRAPAVSANWAGNVAAASQWANGQERSPLLRGELDLDDNYVDLVDYEGSPALDSVRDLVGQDRAEWRGTSEQIPSGSLSRDPEAVGLRMARFVDAVRRARQQLRREYPERAGTDHGAGTPRGKT